MLGLGAWLPASQFDLPLTYEAGSPDRDAAAAMTLALFFFTDPGQQTR